MMEILQNFVAFSEYMNFNKKSFGEFGKMVLARIKRFGQILLQ